MEMQIKSRKLERTITFSRPSKGYIFVDLNGKPGVLGRQICSGGGMTGSTISYSGDSQAEFEAICRRWYKSHLRT